MIQVNELRITPNNSHLIIDVAIRDDEFFDAVMLEDTPNRQNFPFPDTAPWITSEGVVFQYKEYEIASYAQGKPYCIIPLSQVQSFFTSSVKRMLE